MNVDSTSATALATADALRSILPEQHLAALVVLGVLTGLFQLIFGLLKLGLLTRFISNAVMTGFLTGIAVLTVLGQVADLTGYDSEFGNRVARVVDTVLHAPDIAPLRADEQVRVERIVPLPDGQFREGAIPAEVPSGEILILEPLGTLFFAGAVELEEELPDVGDSRGAVVILRLRGRDEVGSTFIHVLERYATALQDRGGRLLLEGVDEAVLGQLERTGFLDAVGRDSVFAKRPTYGESLREAIAEAEARLGRTSE